MVTTGDVVAGTSWLFRAGRAWIFSNILHWTFSGWRRPEFRDRDGGIADQWTIFQEITTSAFNYPCVALVRRVCGESRICQVGVGYGIDRTNGTGSGFDESAVATA